MVLKKISYKNKVVFDYFEIWLKEKEGVFINYFDHNVINRDRTDFLAKASCVSTQICPWCAKKYGLYSEVERTPESVDEEITFYKNEDPEEFNFTCGVDGCNNGLADYVDIPWEYFEIVEEE